MEGEAGENQVFEGYGQSGGPVRKKDGYADKSDQTYGPQSKCRVAYAESQTYQAQLRRRE